MKDKARRRYRKKLRTDGAVCLLGRSLSLSASLIIFVLWNCPWALCDAAHLYSNRSAWQTDYHWWKLSSENHCKSATSASAAGGDGRNKNSIATYPLVIIERDANEVGFYHLKLPPQICFSHLKCLSCCLLHFGENSISLVFLFIFYAPFHGFKHIVETASRILQRRPLFSMTVCLVRRSTVSSCNCIIARKNNHCTHLLSVR